MAAMWLSENLATILVSIFLLVIVGLIIRSMISDKKKGKSSCGGSCGCCPMSGKCHSASTIIAKQAKRK